MTVYCFLFSFLKYMAWTPFLVSDKFKNFRKTEMPSATTGGVAWRGSTCFVRARGVACYVRNNLSSTKRNFFPHDIETIFKEIFLPKTKPMKVGIVYWTPSQTRFLKTMNEHFYEPDTINKEIYILGDFNINLY